METLWKKDQGLHPAFAAINRCLQEDWFLLTHELRLQRAHAEALEAAGILTGVERASIDGALDRIAEQHEGGACPASDAEDLHTWLEAEVTALAGEAGKKIHTARSRNDQVATLLRLYVIESGRGLAQDVRRLAVVLCRRAKTWAHLAFPLQTHCQFAAPGNVGFWALRFATGLDRTRRHLEFLVSEWRRHCPLGSGAVAGSSIPVDRHVQARALGFDGPSWNALDSTSTRDECLELLAVGAQAGLCLQSLATDVILFSQTPFGWTVYPPDFATGSSMMPNKTNPDAMELLRGECCAVSAAHGHALMLLKGLPSGYNRDLQCIKPLVRDALTTLGRMCEMATAFVEGLAFDKQRMREAMNLGAIDATLRMERSVMEGTPLREAHHAVAASLGDRGSSESMTTDMDRYQTVGSASPAETRRVAEALLAELDAGGGS